MNDYAFGNFLTQLRNEKGLSQAEVGNLLGVTNKAVSKWENGATKPNTKLLPMLANLYGVSVEELFAAKRIEQDEEAERVKNFLGKQKKRLAVLSSFYGAILLILPPLLVEFICIVMGFGIPDDVVGPLGAMSFIFLFIISCVSFLIYSSNFKKTPAPSIRLYSDREVGYMRRATVIIAILVFYINVLLAPLMFLVLDKTENLRAAFYFLFAAIFVIILLVGALLYILGLKRRLKIKFRKPPCVKSADEAEREGWKEQPIWVKICLAFAILALPIQISTYIWGGYETGGAFLIGFLSAPYWGAILAVSIYQLLKIKNLKK